MNLRPVSTILFGVALTSAAIAQQGAAPAQRTGGGSGQRSGAGALGGMMGRGVTGTVTEVTADHYTIKTQNGETYTIHYSVNTRFMKQQAATARSEGTAKDSEQGATQGIGRSQRAGQEAQGDRQNRGFGGAPPQQIKSTDIKVGDAIAASGEVDSAAKSVGAIGVFQLDPERAKQLQQMQANYGKTWLMGKVTAINEVQVTLLGSVDNAPHTFVADENTSFRERNNPITLADIHVDDVVRVEGTVKDGIFTAIAVNMMRIPAEATRVQRNTPPPR